MAPEFRYIRLPKWKWRLEADYRYWTPIRNIFIDTQYATLQKNGWLTLRKGYAWDGSTYVQDTKASQPASAVHDVFYQFFQLGLLSVAYRAIADRAYYDLCREYRMNPIRAWIRWRGVRRGAWFAARLKKQPEVITVS